jgi:hypothetical protein
MNHKRTFLSIAMAATVLVSLFAVISSAASVSGQTMAGTGPATTSGEAGAPVLFAVDTSGHVWWTDPESGGSWSSIGGSATSSPAATTLSNGVIDVFVRGTNGALYENTAANYGASWSGWTSLDGHIASGTGPAACSWGAGRLDVFVQGTDGALYHKWSANSGATWSAWQGLGGKLSSSPAATCDVIVHPPANLIYVFVRGTDGACWYKEWTGTAWSSWKSLGGQLAPNTGPAALGEYFNTTNTTTSYVHGYEVFVQGTDYQLWGQGYGEVGSAWSHLPACPEALSASSSAVVFSFDGHSEVFISTTGGNLMYCYATANGWEWLSQTSPS